MRKLLLTVVGLTLSGCSDVPTGLDTILLESRIPDVARERSRMSERVFHGSYSLETVNGEDLPYVFVDLPNPLDLKQEVIGGEFTIRDDGTYEFVSHFRDTQSGVVREYSDVTGGTYSTSGFDIEFVESSGFVFSGSLLGTSLAFEYRGFSLVFSK